MEDHEKNRAREGDLMNKVLAVIFAVVMVIPTLLIGDVRAGNAAPAFAQENGQTTGSVTVRRRRHGVVRRNSARAYRGGKYVARKTVHGAKYVSHKTVQGTRYTVHTVHHTGRKVVSRTKKVVQ